MEPAKYAFVYKMMMKLLTQMRATNEESRRWRETGERSPPAPEIPQKAHTMSTAFHQNW